tara:strand:- start:64498 stop:65796 length:1299 start_codon:yes stop_codon:yes gene_type:complete
MSFTYLSFVTTIKEHIWAKVLLGLVLGVVVGVALGPDLNLIARDLAYSISNWLALPGYLFLAIIRMVVIPLVVSSIICGVAAGGNIETIQKLGFGVVVYFILTTTVAVATGIFLSYLFEPGVGFDAHSFNALTALPPVSDALLDVSNIPKRLVSFIPTNPISSMASGEMLQVVIFSAFVGAALVYMPKAKAKPFLDVVVSLQALSMVVVDWALKLAPYAVFGLIAQLSIKMGAEALSGMLVYMGVVLAGLLSMLVFYMLVLYFFCGRNPFEFLAQIRNVQLIAFSTSSSSATMPVTLKTAEEKVGINPTVSRFIVPLGATINMDGTALYQAIATIFLAQVFVLDLTTTDILIALATSIAASIGTPGTPGVGIVVLATILSSVGVPVEGIAIILGVDRLLDMCRTTINVTGDLVACAVMERIMHLRKKRQKSV